MLSLLAAVAVAQAPTFAPPILWAAGFAAPPRIPLVGDVNADGYADLICVYPPGGSIIDVSLNQKGQKAGVPFQALNPWGKDCQAAVAMEFDEKNGADVIGLFDGDTIRVAGDFENGKYKDKELVKLPRKLRQATMAQGSDHVFVSSGKDKLGFTVWSDGTYKSHKVSDGPPDHRTNPGTTSSGYRSGARISFDADWDNDGDKDGIIYRYGSERHTAHDILLIRALTVKNPDEDSDGLTNEQEAALKTDPLNPDTDGDGLLDGWEMGTYRDLDLKGMGCSPTKIDLICLISRYSNVDEAKVKAELERVRKTYAELDHTNPDGSKGFAFHPVYLDPVAEKDHANGWPTNRDKFRPAKWRGLVHWMQITNGGGGQADQMGDGGSCGLNSLWAVFLHEFGHQIGMDHEGFWRAGLCPIYTSLMNYAYSYSVEDDGNKIRYSTGKFKDFVLNENNLDENLPLPYDDVKFLEKGPYRFRLKPNGKTTQIDWNWNGIFGEKNIRADINYSYSTNAGRRDEIGKIMTSPWLFTHQGKAWAAYGTHDEKADPKTDPTVSPSKPGTLLLRSLKEPFKWGEPIKPIVGRRLMGDPVAISHAGSIYVAAAMGPATPELTEGLDTEGVFLFRFDAKGSMLDSELLAPDPDFVPSISSYKGVLYVFLWDPSTGAVTYRTSEPGSMRAPVASSRRPIGNADHLVLSAEKRLLRRSTIPVGMAVDTIRNEILIGAAEDQDKNRPGRWQIRRYKDANGYLVEKSVEWIEGEAGGSRGQGRCTVLFDSSKEAGKDGRIYFFGRGYTTKENPWGCTYVAHQIADKTVRGGWLVKRFYDEWTQTRSAPAAAWFDKDIIWAYRWVDGGQGERDNLFHVGYRALGIDPEPMGDHDDIAFFRDIGIRRSILWLGAN